MRVLYDSAGFAEPFGGVSHSFVELIRHLPATVEPVLAVRTTCNYELQAAPFCIPAHPDRYENFIAPGHFRGKWRLWRLAQRLFPGRYPNDEAANAACLDGWLERGDFDVLHLTGAHVYGDAWRRVVGKKPIVITVHDLIPEIIRHDRRIAGLRREILAVASRVVAVSENTKRDLVRLYGLPESRIAVIHHGASSPSVAGAPAPARPYLLYVGRRDGYKNWAWFVRAVAPALRAQGLRLVCTGADFTHGERRLLRKLGLSELVEHRCLQAGELAAVYAQAVAFVSPSLYEGFGLPILDAFAAGCPVLLSRASCFPEVAGDGAAYFDPQDAESLRALVRRVSTDRAFAAELVARGRRRLAAFDWRVSAKRLADVYGKASGGYVKARTCR